MVYLEHTVLGELVEHLEHSAHSSIDLLERSVYLDYLAISV